MSHLYARCALIALLLLSSTTFVQASTLEILYNDPQLIYTPKDTWSTWTYNETVPCPGMWAPGSEDGKSKINFSFKGTGVTVYGYSDGVAPWLFQLDNESAEASTVLPGEPCRVIKDSQGLQDEKHQVVITPQSSHFVITKLVVNTGGVSSGPGNGTTTGTHTPHTTSTSRAFGLDGGKQVVRFLPFALPAYFFIALSGL